MIDEAVESKLAALCLLAAPCAQRSLALREEFLRLLGLRYTLTADQKAWCQQMLTDEESVRRHADVIGEAMGSAVGTDECQLMWDIVDWFLDDTAIKEQFLEDLGELGHVPEEGSLLFTPEAAQAFEIIGLAPTFDGAAVQKAFRDSMRLIHPDAATSVGLSRDEVLRAEELSKRVIAARETIVACYRGFELNQGA
jgi:hypothetical protein